MADDKKKDVPKEVVTSKKLQRAETSGKKIIPPLRSDMRGGDYKTR